MNIPGNEITSWLDCINYIFRKAEEKTIDEIYSELLDRFILEEELRQLQLDFINLDSIAP